MRVEREKWKVIVLICVSIAFHFPLSTFHSLKAQVAGLNALPMLKRSSMAHTNALSLRYLPLYSDNIVVGIDSIISAKCG